MVRFHGLCDGKIMVRKMVFFSFCVESFSFSAKSWRAFSNWLVACRLWNEGLSIRFLVHGKSILRV